MGLLVLNQPLAAYLMTGNLFEEITSSQQAISHEVHKDFKTFICCSFSVLPLNWTVGMVGILSSIIEDAFIVLVFNSLHFIHCFLLLFISTPSKGF